MKIDLSNQVAIITGAAGAGLGRAHAQMLGLAGCKIAIVDIADASETLSFLNNLGITAKAYKTDIASSDSVQNTIRQILADFGGVHILVNNASILNTIGLFADMPEDKFNRDVQVNLIGTANITRAVWPHLLAQKSGRVVFISSIAGLRGGGGQASYAATKASVIGLAKSLAIEGARSNITVNAVAPGVVETPTAMTMIRDDMKERMKKSVPMRRFATPEDIANTVCFLCSQQASYITGQVITVDGGSGLFVFWFDV